MKYAAILVLDENEAHFLPAAYIGFDSTTRRRLRIPREIIDQHSAFETKGLLSLKGDDRIILEPFFSVREYGIFTRIDVTGIRYDNSTYALLLAAWKEDEEGKHPAKYEPLRPEYGKRLFSCYSLKLKGLLPPPYFYDNPVQAVKSLEPIINRYRDAGRFIHICRVNLKTLIETVKPVSPTADMFRFREDVLRMLNSLVSAIGIFYEKSEDEVILGFAAAATQDGDFLAHHLCLSISDFFPQTALPASTIISCKSIRPDEILDPQSVLFD